MNEDGGNDNHESNASYVNLSHCLYLLEIESNQSTMRVFLNPGRGDGEGHAYCANVEGVDFYGTDEGDGTFACRVYDSEAVEAQRNVQQCPEAGRTAAPDHKASRVTVSNIVACI